MKTVTGSVNSAKPISLSKATILLSGFVSSETQASQDVSAYLRRASAAFTELRGFHREIRSGNPNSEAKHPKEELGRAKGVDDKKKKKRKENKEKDVVVEDKVMVKLEDESKKEDVDDEKVNVKLEEERKSKKKRKLSKED